MTLRNYSQKCVNEKIKQQSNQEMEIFIWANKNCNLKDSLSKSSENRFEEARGRAVYVWFWWRRYNQAHISAEGRC